MLLDYLVAPILLLLLFVAQEIGFLIGRRHAVRGEAGKESAGQVGAVQGAALGLLGLLLGFSFAGAAGRFIERQDLITTEANAIGTAYLRAAVLEPPQRAELRDALREYTAHRIALSPSLRDGLTEQMADEIAAYHKRIWDAAAEGMRQHPEAMVVVLSSVNDVLDTHSLRIAAGRKHLPLQVLGLLIGSSAVALAVMGYGCGLAGRRQRTLLLALIVLIAGALWTTIDLDRPRSGLLQLNDAALRELKFD